MSKQKRFARSIMNTLSNIKDLATGKRNIRGKFRKDETKKNSKKVDLICLILSFMI